MKMGYSKKEVYEMKREKRRWLEEKFDVEEET